MTPVYKEGPKTKAENYRPISLTCITNKYKTLLYHKRLKKKISVNSNLSLVISGVI